MSSRPKSDLPLTSQFLTWINTLSGHHRTEPELHEPVIAEAPAPVHARYKVWPLAQLSCSSSNDPAKGAYNLGVTLMRSKNSAGDSGSNACNKDSSSVTRLSLAAPSIMSYAPQETSAAVRGSRKRLSDADASKLRWLKRLPSLAAEHQQIINKIQKLQLKAMLDLNSNKYSAEAIWFAKVEGQPARLKCKWSEGSPHTLLFDAAVALRGSPHRLKLTGQPHQLQSASVILTRSKASSDDSAAADRPEFDVQPLNPSSSSWAAAVAAHGDDGSSSTTAEQPVNRVFDQPGLQLELGYNLLANTPILSASRRFGSSSSSSVSSSWAVRQVKAAYDGKSNNLSLAAAGATWNLGVVFPTESSGPIGLPRPPSDGSWWPKLTLSLTPEVSFDTL